MVPGRTDAGNQRNTISFGVGSALTMSQTVRSALSIPTSDNHSEVDGPSNCALASGAP